MDRIAPTRRPVGNNAGTQKWRKLLFIHWPVPVDALRPLLPERLSIDTYDEVAYVGIVPFEMHDVAPSWLPNALAFNFLETNLRTYVHLDGEGPGVWFFSLEAASRLAVQAARTGWGLPYHYAHMELKEDGHEFVYESIRHAAPSPRLMVRYRVGDFLGPSEPGTLQHWLLERYLLYSVKDDQLQLGQVYHTPYPAHAATVSEAEDELCVAAGLPQPQGLPPLAHYAPGVDVEVFAVRPV